MLIESDDIDQIRLNETVDHLLNVLDDMLIVIDPNRAIEGKFEKAAVYKLIDNALRYQQRLLQEAALKIILLDDTDIKTVI